MKLEENETIDDLILKDKWSVIENDILEVPDYSYWASQEPLNASYQLRNIKWWWKVKTLIFERLASVWTWTQSFTWFWFTPTSYTIQTTRTWITTTFYPCFSDWAYDWTTQMIRQVADWYSRVLTWCVWRLLYTNQWWWTTNIVHSSLDTDWITLNFTTSSEDCYLVITCYW